MIRVLVSESEVGEAEKLSGLIGTAADIQVVGVSRDGIETAQMIAQTKPDVALVHASMPGMDGYEVTKMGALASPMTASIIIAPMNAPESQVRDKAMRAGARGVALRTMEPMDLLELIREVGGGSAPKDDEMYKLVTDPNRMPMVVAVTGAKGGIGKTTTSTNLALALHSQFPGQVCLVDFMGHYGDINLLLNMPASGGILDLAQYDEVDPSILRSRLIKHESGLMVLQGVNGPESMTAMGMVNTRWVASLLGTLRREFRVIVIDISAVIYPLSQYIFLRASHIVVMSVLADLSTIRDTGALVRGLLESRIPPERIKLVVNRYFRGDDFSPADLEEVTQHPITQTIPFDRETVIAALNSGSPFVLSKPRAPVSQALYDLADAIIKDSPGGRASVQTPPPALASAPEPEDEGTRKAESIDEPERTPANATIRRLIPFRSAGRT